MNYASYRQSTFLTNENYLEILACLDGWYDNVSNTPQMVAPRFLFSQYEHSSVHLKTWNEIPSPVLLTVLGHTGHRSLPRLCWSNIPDISQDYEGHGLYHILPAQSQRRVSPSSRFANYLLHSSFPSYWMIFQGSRRSSPVMTVPQVRLWRWRRTLRLLSRLGRVVRPSTMWTAGSTTSWGPAPGWRSPATSRWRGGVKTVAEETGCLSHTEVKHSSK